MISTGDRHDAHPDLMRVCETQFRSHGGLTAFSGPCATVATFEDHSPVLAMRRTPGLGGRWPGIDADRDCVVVSQAQLSG